MPGDQTDPDTFEEIVNDDKRRPAAEEPGTETPEAPEADVAEQHTELVEPQEEALPGPTRDDVDPADAADQARVVEMNEDEYR
ncbi:hypothetical protein [Streptomyces sp. JJ38]|uniref:hypothetical protein n=1 Tax=Streptomyces sp. JJ38 TaxID=2738128 RepID=UPI001C56A821|nr:hypothetical protein [Streptomyces sp. JJ38]MBW1598776.1 hypothetical protein [Streptomyces sp. JJ38]